MIETFTDPRMGANTYLVFDENTNDAVVIDASASADEVLGFSKEKGLNVRAVLLTHGHFDHIAHVPVYSEAGIPVGICKLDKYMLAGSPDNLAAAFGEPVINAKADFVFKGGDVLNFGALSFKVLLTAGHTKGSCCFVLTSKSGDKACFSGDTLFFESVGRTDFPTGNHSDLMRSLREKLFPLDLPVYPGHGKPTHTAHEREFNPYAGVL